MTLIIGKQGPAYVDVYTDSLVTCGDDAPCEHYEKAFQRHGVFWASAGDLVIDQYIKALQLEPWVPQGNGVFEDWFTYNIIVGMSQLKDVMPEGWDWSAVVVAHGVLYEVSADLTLTKPSRGYACLGSGAPFAYGAIEMVQGVWQWQQVYTAVQRLRKDVGGPSYGYRIDPSGAVSRIGGFEQRGVAGSPYVVRNGERRWGRDGREPVEDAFATLPGEIDGPDDAA